MAEGKFFVYEIYDQNDIVRYIGFSADKHRPKFQRVSELESWRIVFRTDVKREALDKERELIKSHPVGQLRNKVHTEDFERTNFVGPTGRAYERYLLKRNRSAKS